jgi:hypothetical protein
MPSHSKHSLRARSWLAWTALTSSLALCGCAAQQRPATANQSQSASPTAALSSSSTVQCTTDGECGVCYRQGTCGEPLAATDPTIETPACHVAPAAFCMPRRAHCDSGRCTAR